MVVQVLTNHVATTERPVLRCSIVVYIERTSGLQLDKNGHLRSVVSRHMIIEDKLIAVNVYI